MKPEIAVGAAMRAVRNSLQLTQNQVADEANIERDYLSRVELGKPCLSIVILWQIADALRIEPGALITIGNEVFRSAETQPPQSAQVSLSAEHQPPLSPLAAAALEELRTRKPPKKPILKT